MHDQSHLPPMAAHDLPDFSRGDGLLPVVTQDAETGEVLMLGFLNEASYAKTLETGFVTFWSRTRQKLWMKGETRRVRDGDCRALFKSAVVMAAVAVDPSAAERSRLPT